MNDAGEQAEPHAKGGASPAPGRRSHRTGVRTIERTAGEAGRRHGRLWGRLAALAAASVVLTGTVVAATDVADAHPYAWAESDTVWLINQTRGAAGLGAVGQDEWLTVLAHQHAQRLAQANTLYHQDLSVPMGWGWHWVAENVSYSSAGLIGAHDVLQQSPPHLANMRNPWAYATGTGIAVAHGRVFMVQLLAY